MHCFQRVKYGKWKLKTAVGKTGRQNFNQESKVSITSKRHIAVMCTLMWCNEESFSSPKPRAFILLWEMSEIPKLRNVLQNIYDQYLQKYPSTKTKGSFHRLETIKEKWQVNTRHYPNFASWNIRNICRKDIKWKNWNVNKGSGVTIALYWC